MGAQGWHRDPFLLHEDRWFSDGRPTHLVRDQSAESYDEPPPCELPALPVSSDEDSAGQLARARLLSGGIAPATRAVSGMADFANRKPARNWRYWTVLPPCLLTLALAVLATLGLISSAASRAGDRQKFAGSFVSGTGNPVGWSLLTEAGLIAASVAVIVVAYIAADDTTSRRACAATGWVIAALAYGWALLIALLASIAR